GGGRRAGEGWRRRGAGGGGGVLLWGVGGLVSWRALWAGRPEPQKPSGAERLRVRLAQAAPGRPVKLLGEGLAGDPPLVVGEPYARYLDRPGECPWLNTPSICLMELLPPDPCPGDYRLTAELAHTAAAGLSRHGLYAGYSPHAADDGTITHAFFQASFCDPQFVPAVVQDGRDPLLTPGLVVLTTERNGQIKNHHHLGAGVARPLPGRQREHGVIDRTFV